MSSGGYYNGPVADWARRNIRGRVRVTPRFSSRPGRIFVYALLFSAPGAFIALGLTLFALGAGAKDGAGALLFYGSLMLIPCGLIALVGAYVRRGFARSLDAEGARGAFGQSFPWGKLYYCGPRLEGRHQGRGSPQGQRQPARTGLRGRQARHPADDPQPGRGLGPNQQHAGRGQGRRRPEAGRAPTPGETRAGPGSK